MIPGDQAFYCYGDRSKKFLLLNYGFCFADNRYDSYHFWVKIDINLNDLFVPFMINFQDTEDYSQEIRIKTHQLNGLLFSYLRIICKTKFIKSLQAFEAEDILLTKPVSLHYEIFCLTYYD